MPRNVQFHMVSLDVSATLSNFRLSDLIRSAARFSFDSAAR